MKTYTQLTQKQRYQIHALLKTGHRATEIAYVIGVHPSTISRQYFPKHRHFATITEEEIQKVMTKLNNRPRKSLGFQTLNQVCFGINPSMALAS